MDKELSVLIDEYIADFEYKKTLPIVVKNSIPIIWFGNIEKYSTSSKKVITIAINPSLAEFPEDDNRFPKALHNFNKENLYKSLNEYFEINPYNKWFNNYEKKLNCVNATYGGIIGNKNMLNTAINIDLFSSIATNPTWGKLSDIYKIQVANVRLFDKFYSYLNPDVVFISTAKENATDYFKFCEMQTIFSECDGNFEGYTDGKRKIIFGKNRSTVFSGSGMTDEFIKETLIKYNI